MATRERMDPRRDAPREAPDAREREKAGAPPSPEEVVTPRGAGVVPEPELEEVPELLGERSDYPIPSGEDAERPR
jgi:hypothetical protein